MPHSNSEVDFISSNTHIIRYPLSADAISAPFMPISSFVKTNDGRILYVYSTDSSLMQGYVSDVETLVGQNNSVTNKTSILTIHEPSACVSRAGNELVLVVAGRTGAADPYYWGVYLYKSPSGNGGDWVYTSNVRAAVQHNGVNVSHNAGFRGGRPVSEVYVAPNGRWIVGAPLFHAQANGVLYAVPSIYTSDNQGTSWSWRSLLGATLDDNYSAGVGRNFASFDGGIWITTATRPSEPSPGPSRLLKTIDDGMNWTVEYSGYDTRLRLANTILTDTLYMYVAHGVPDISGVYSTIQRISSPQSTFTSWNQHRVYDNPNMGDTANRDFFCAIIDDKLILENLGNLIYLSTVLTSGWVIGNVPIG